MHTNTFFFFFGVQFLVVQHRGQIASRCTGPVVASLASYMSLWSGTVAGKGRDSFAEGPAGVNGVNMCSRH